MFLAFITIPALKLRNYTRPPFSEDKQLDFAESAELKKPELPLALRKIIKFDGL